MVPARGGGVAAASPGNPFVVAAAPAASTSSTAPDPFAKLASGLIGPAPQPLPRSKKTNKSDFVQETPKPSLLNLSKQQQQQQQQGGDVTDVTEQVEQQTNVDIFGATPVSVQDVF